MPRGRGQKMQADADAKPCPNFCSDASMLPALSIWLAHFDPFTCSPASFRLQLNWMQLQLKIILFKQKMTRSWISVLMTGIPPLYQPSRTYELTGVVSAIRHLLCRIHFLQNSTRNPSLTNIKFRPVTYLCHPIIITKNDKSDTILKLLPSSNRILGMCIHHY